MPSTDKPTRTPLCSELAGDPDMLEVLREYADALVERCLELERLLAGKQWDAARRLAHQTKGAGGMYGYPELSEIAGLLEAALDDRQPPELLEELRLEFAATVQAVRDGLRQTA